MRRIILSIKKFCSFSCLVLLITFIDIFTANAFDASVLLSNQAKVYLLTYSPGLKAYSIFGHTALRVKDPVNNIDYVYNYGTFNFDVKGFYVKFILGNLDYSISRDDFNNVLGDLILENRTIAEQEIFFNQNQMQQLFQRLETNYSPANRYYRYRFIRDNCSTRVRNMLFLVAGQNINLDSTKDVSATYHDLIHKYLVKKPWLKMGVNILLGRETDKNATFCGKMFLPEYLENELTSATITNTGHISPLVSLPVVVFMVSPVKTMWIALPPPMIVFGMITLIYIALFAFYSPFRKSLAPGITVYIITGLLGILILAITSFTNHPELKMNLNLLWACPLNLLVLALMSSINHRYLTIYAAAYLLVLIFTLVFAPIIHFVPDEGALSVILLIMISNLHILIHPKIVSLSENHS